MHLGTETGSLINHLMSRGGQPAPKVGDGATICGWTDRHPATIVKVTATQVHVQGDIATRTDSNGMSECQEYTYTPNPAAGVQIFRRRKNGTYRNANGEGLIIGRREKYYDFSF